MPEPADLDWRDAEDSRGVTRRGAQPNWGTFLQKNRSTRTPYGVRRRGRTTPDYSAQCARLLKKWRVTARDGIDPDMSRCRKLEDRTRRPFAGLEPRSTGFPVASRLPVRNPPASGWPTVYPKRNRQIWKWGYTRIGVGSGPSGSSLTTNPSAFVAARKLQQVLATIIRSEERRVGKECRS